MDSTTTTTTTTMVPRHEATPFPEMFHEKFEGTFISDDREKDSRGIDNTESTRVNGSLL
jgi:hypothetical protein